MPKVPPPINSPTIPNENPIRKIYRFHGVVLSGNNDSQEGCGECPFCGKTKFYVSLKEDSGLYICHACNMKGNPQTFLEELYRISFENKETNYAWIEKHRGISKDTLRKWGVCLSATTQEWIIPGYAPTGRICNIYKYILDKESGKHILYGTPKQQPGLFGVPLLDTKKDTIDICEGPWDAMVWRRETNRPVVAVPGCGIFNESWRKLTALKKVSILYDNDYPRKNGQRPAFDGMKHAIEVMTSGDHKPSSIEYLHWGNDGYTTSYPDGYDIRDIFSSKDSNEAINIILGMVRPVPQDWESQEGKIQDIESLDCKDWASLKRAWIDAVQFSQGMEWAILCSLASILSVRFTTIGDEQIWMKIIAPPSSGKTLVCEALGAATKYVISKSAFNGFYSGYKSDKEGKEDHSLITKLNNRTLVTKDGDTLLQSEYKARILSQGRDLYDGTSRKSYNNAVNREYQTRMTWLLFGTPALREIDKSELGCRFLDLVMVDRLEENLERSMIRRAISQQIRNLGNEANCKADSNTDKLYLIVKRMTKGYIEHLKRESTTAVDKIVCPDWFVDSCEELALFVSYLRARPNSEDEEGTRELGMRVGKQLSKLAGFLAFVMNKTIIDKQVFAIVRRVAIDTARGRTQEIVKAIMELAGQSNKPLEGSTIAAYTNQNPSRESEYLRFLRSIQVVKNDGIKWVLTPTFKKVYLKVIGTPNNG